MQWHGHEYSFFGGNECSFSVQFSENRKWKGKSDESLNITLHVSKKYVKTLEMWKSVGLFNKLDDSILSWWSYAFTVKTDTTHIIQIFKNLLC